MKKKFTVSGMTCASCSSHVEKAVSACPGVSHCEVSLLSNSMTVEYEGVTADEIIACVKKAGYGASEYDAKASDDGKKIRALKIRLIVSLCFLVPLFYITMGAMLGAPVPFFLEGKYMWIGALVQICLTLPVMIVNYKYFTVGYKRLFTGSPNMDSLIAIGSSAAFVYGIFAFVRIVMGTAAGDWHLVHKYGMDLYFESAATILTLVTVGKFFETRSRGKTGEAIEKLMNLAPKTAVVVGSDGDREVAVEDISVGDLIRIKPGDSIPVDGVIVEGGSGVDQSVITGESIPVYKTIGDRVVSGSVNDSGTFVYRADKVGEDTTLAQIVKLVGEAADSKAPIARLADKVSGIFVPVVIAIAVVAFAAWLIAGQSFVFAMSKGIAVLVISCPCALGLATPVAIMVGTGKGAENGILIKSAESFELLSKAEVVVLDKTGTVTEGKPSVTDVRAFIDEKELLEYAFVLENNSSHPLASAVVEYCKGREICAGAEVSEFENIAGRGVKCVYRGKKLLSGNANFMAEENIDVGNAAGFVDEFARAGKTPLFFAAGQELVGIIAVRDEIKPTGKEAIADFKEMGMDVVMMTGDLSATAQAIGREAGIDNIISEVLPQNKEKEVSAFMERGKITVMIGDGINDAPALTKSNVGIAVGAGADVAIESADIVLLRSDLKDASAAAKLSRKVMRIIKGNLFFAFVYNSIGIPIAAGVFYPLLGWSLNPMFAAAAMSLSSLCVVSNALRIRNFSPDKKSRPRKPDDKNKKNNIKNLGSDQNNRADRDKNEEDIMEKTFTVNGMMCEHCKMHVEQALKEVTGVKKVKVDLKKKTTTVKADDSVTDEMLKAAVKSAGYDAEL